MRELYLCAPYFATAVLAAGAVMNAGTGANLDQGLAGLRMKLSLMPPLPSSLPPTAEEY